MKRITQRTLALSILMLACASVAMSAPKSRRSNDYLRIEGRVLQVNREARTLLVADSWSKKLYLVNVPKGESFRITFGMHMKTAVPVFEEVRRNDRVQMRCVRATDKDRLARLDDGREVVMLTATH